MKLKQILLEGVYDPGILKCVFLVGGPGSGKSFVMNQLFGVTDKIKFSTYGLKLVTPDPAFEALLKLNKINPGELDKIYQADKDFYDSKIEPIRQKAKDITDKIERNYITGRLGLILEGTGKNAESIIRLKTLMESLGYDCYMIFVNTSLEVAKKRNEKRERTLPVDILTKLWESAQQNLGKFQSLFGTQNMLIIDNSKDAGLGQDISKAVNAFIKRPLRNQIGKKWIENELKNKKR